MERIKSTELFVVMAAAFSLAPVTLAQRGMGDATGVVRQGLTPRTVMLEGKVARIITGPCENSTGPSDMGAHFILTIEEGQAQNIHLGPARQVQGVTDLLTNGGTVSVCAFRTDNMPPCHYNAVTVTLGRKTVRLRRQDLRPLWAGDTSLWTPNRSPRDRIGTRDGRTGGPRWMGRLRRGRQTSPQGCRFQSSRRRGQGRGRCRHYR